MRALEKAAAPDVRGCKPSMYPELGGASLNVSVIIQIPDDFSGSCIGVIEVVIMISGSGRIPLETSTQKTTQELAWISVWEVSFCL